MTTAPAARVAVRLADRTLDVAVPAGVTVYEVLRAVDVDLDDPRLTLVDSSGARVDLYSTTADDLVDGAVLHVLAPDAGPASGGRAGRDAEPAAARAGAPWWLVLGAVATAVLVAVAGLDAVGASSGGAAPSLAPLDRLLVAATLALVALALAVPRPGPAGGTWPTVVAVLAGAGAGAIGVDPTLPAAGRLVVVAGLAGATTAAAARWALTRRVRDDAADLAAVLLVVLAGAAAVCGGVLLLGLPSAVAAAALLGAVPLALRALPSLCVDVPDEQLLDVSQVSRTAPAVRAPRPQPLGPVNGRMVHRSLQGAERRRTAGTVVLALVAPVAGPVLLATGPGGLPGWGALVACLLVAVVLGLAPRTARGTVVRWAPRGAAVLLLVGIGLVAAVGQGPAGVADGGPAGTTAVTVVAVLLALLVAAVSLPIGRGWRSVGWSRAADALEGLATVLALPVALAGAGLIELLRQATSS